MTWTWRYEDAEGNPVPVAGTESFSTRSDAETWLGECWPDLLDRGVLQVSLLDGDRTVYAMPLTPAEEDPE